MRLFLPGNQGGLVSIYENKTVQDIHFAGNGLTNQWHVFIQYILYQMKKEKAHTMLLKGNNVLLCDCDDRAQESFFIMITVLAD